MSKTADIIADLHSYLANKEKVIKDLLINEHIGKDLFNELKFQVKEGLAKLFGPEADSADWGQFSDVYNYKDGQASPTLDDGLLLAYWSHNPESAKSESWTSDIETSG